MLHTLKNKNMVFDTKETGKRTYKSHPQINDYVYNIYRLWERVSWILYIYLIKMEIENKLQITREKQLVFWNILIICI